MNKPDLPEHATINDWLEWHGGTIVIGGKVRKELCEIKAVERRIRVLLQAGRARTYPDDVVDSEQAVVEASGQCESDDPHVIALARISGARVLFSSDGALCADFRNSRLVPKPPGKIYRTAKHRHLLLNSPKCRDFPRSRNAPNVAR